MLYISHRGNVSGRTDRENSPLYILNALAEGFNVEIDVWWINNTLMLGHDAPQYEVSEKWLENKKLWCHAKDISTLEKLLQNKKIHCFFHQNDDCTITSNKFIWTYPGKTLTTKSIAVLPERIVIAPDLSSVAGICSDFILNYRNALSSK